MAGFEMVDPVERRGQRLHCCSGRRPAEWTQREARANRFSRVFPPDSRCVSRLRAGYLIPTRQWVVAIDKPEERIALFQRNKVLSPITRSRGRRVRANRLTTDGPRALTCWHGVFQ